MKTVIITVGIPGAGKSTWVKEYAPKDAKYINADTIRKELYGDESIQGNGATVFQILYDRFRRYLLDSKIKTIIVDNTSTTLKARNEIYNLIKENCPDAKVKIKVFDNFEEAKERNKNRDRVVPDEVMDRMIKQFTYPTETETDLNVELI